jgi:hypothetical protein
VLLGELRDASGHRRTDLKDVEERISKASQAFGALKHCLFRRKDVATEAKRSAYCGLIPAMLLYGAEHWWCGCSAHSTTAACGPCAD